jgi:ribosomal protein S4
VLLECFFGFSIWQTKQLVLHGNIYVNNKQIRIPGYLVKEGDLIEFRNTATLYSIYNPKLIQQLSFLFGNVFEYGYVDDISKKKILIDLFKTLKDTNLKNIAEVPENNTKQPKDSDNFLTEYNNTLGCFSFFKPFAKNFIFFGSKILYLKKAQDTFSHVIEKTNLVAMLNWLNK